MYYIIEYLLLQEVLFYKVNNKLYILIIYSTVKYSRAIKIKNIIIVLIV